MVETKLIEQLKNNQSIQAPALSEQKSDVVDNLVVKLLNEKFNKKYEGKLTEDQRALIRDYVVTNTSGTPSQETLDRAKRIKEEAVQSLSLIEKTEKNQIVQENLKDVKKLVVELDVTSLNDANLSKLMTLSQLVKEAKETK
jgi:hypothetical protein